MNTWERSCSRLLPLVPRADLSHAVGERWAIDHLAALLSTPDRNFNALAKWKVGIKDLSVLKAYARESRLPQLFQATLYAWFGGDHGLVNPLWQRRVLFSKKRQVVLGALPQFFMA